MSDQSISTQLLCAQCGGELNPDQGQLFETCPYCGTTVYLDKSQVVFHWYLSPTLDEPKARAALRRWMSGNDTVKDLDRKSKLLGHKFSYFPMWFFRVAEGGKEKIYLQPAAATSVSEIKRLKIPAGDLRNYEASLDADALAPSVPLTAARGWLRARGGSADQVAETALVHLPIHRYKYNFDGKPYTAMVEAGTGRVMANIFPEKAETPYALVSVITIGGFLLLATIPLLGGLLGQDEGMMLGVLACLGLAIPFGGVTFALAAWVAAKV